MSKLILTLFNEQGDIIKQETFMKLTEISKKYDIPYASLFSIVDEKYLKKSRLSKKTTELVKRFKVTTQINSKIADAINTAINDELIVTEVES
nr:MAG: hypothetical protein [Lake Baikal virophage 9]